MANDTEVSLHQLLEACNNCEAAYMNSAENETNETLRELYRQYAAEMAKCALELQGQIERFGGNGDLVRTESEEDVASEAISWDVREEQEKALTLYEQALDREWPEDLPELIERHFTLLEESADHLEEVLGLRTPDRAGDEDADNGGSGGDDDSEKDSGRDIGELHVQ